MIGMHPHHRKHPVLKKLFNWLIPILLAVAALLGLWWLGQENEKRIYDLFMRWSARPATDSRVVLVLIDDDSIEKLKSRFGAVPWPRKTYVEIFRRIDAHHPALMVLDGHFVNINQTEDVAVFQEMKKFPNLISGLVMNEMNGTEANDLNTDNPHYYRLNLGVVSNRQDPDGAIRMLKPVYQVRANARQTGVFPALSLAAAYEYLNRTRPGETWIMDVDRRAKPPHLALYPESAPSQGIRLPMNPDDAFYMRYYRLLSGEDGGYRRSHPAIPLWRFFEPEAGIQPDLKGRIALIGSSSTFYRDYSPTPMAFRHLGPDIHATAIDNLLEQQAIRKVSPAVNLLLLLGLFGAVLLLRFRFRDIGQTLLYTLGTMIIYMSVAFWLFSQHALWLDVLTPELFIGVAFLTGSTLRIVLKERQLATMEQNLMQLVDPGVFQEILKMDDILRPGGQKLEITSMFVDIRNFTAISEQLQPTEVTDLLSAFYAEVVRVVFVHYGTVDKFMADGILLIFGAPLPSEQHRQRALEAARYILATCQTFRERYKEALNIDLDIGISINSGPAVVGWIGPASNMQYTAIGDTVNTCVRLQEQAKEFQTRLIMSESTAEVLKDDPDLVCLGDVQVRGKEATLKIYTLRPAFITPAADASGPGG